MLRAQPERLLTTPEPAAQPEPQAAPSKRAGRVIEDPVFLSGRVERELRDAFQHQAIRERRAIGELLEAAITEYLARRASEQAE